MKVIALLLMLLGVLLIVGTGLMSLFLFAMSFDAPGSADKPGAWATHSLIFLPLLVFVALLIFAWMAYQSGDYTRSLWLGSVFGVAALGIAVFFGKTSYDTVQEGRAMNAQTAEAARLYPVQEFVRPVEGGADTIIVFPSRTVAYRLYAGGDIPFAGPVGDLNEARDAIVVSSEFDEKIKREEFSQFVDGQGRKLTDVFSIQ